MTTLYWPMETKYYNVIKKAFLCTIIMLWCVMNALNCAFIDSMCVYLHAHRENIIVTSGNIMAQTHSVENFYWN